MRDRHVVGDGAKRARAPLILLGACAVWLVVQNTVLAVALLWTAVPGVATAGTALWKAAAANAGAARDAMAVLAVATLLGLLAAASTHRLDREEARHG